MSGDENDEAATGGAETLPDDLVVPFRLERSGALGRLARLGPVVDAVLRRHDYPVSVSQVLGEALALTAILGAGLKHESKFTLQTQTDGPLGFLVVNFEWPDALRGYATFDADWFAAHAPDPGAGSGALFGNGRLAMTIVPGGGADGTPAGEAPRQYQGIVAMEGQSLVEAAQMYFLQSEQLPTTIHLAVAKHYGTLRNQERDAGGEGWHWRAGGLIVQKLTWEGGKTTPAPAVVEPGEGAPADERPGKERLDWDDDDDWTRTRVLAETVQDHELTDPLLAPERLLFRLFHEENVRAFDAKPMAERCTCSRERIAGVLSRFQADDMADMREADGMVHVTCEFCGRGYDFAADEVG